MTINFKQLVQPYQTTAIANLQKWIQIPSVLDSKTVSKGAPFGEPVKAALRYIGKLAEQDGFKVDYCDGYCTEISFGQGERLIGIYAHSDVVPATGTWQYGAFSGEIADDKIYGRGTSDDKGPAMSAYYAIKALKNAGHLDKFRVVLVIGGNEENGSKCLEYYFDVLKKPYADFGFTPDGSFPLIYGEKAMTNYLHTATLDLGPIMEIKAGLAGNLVIDRAEAKLKTDHNLEQALAKTNLKYSVEHHEEFTTLTMHGRSAHGSVPEMGINSGIQLLAFLGEHYRLYPLTKIARLYKDTDGSELGIATETALLHKTTVNVGVISYQAGAFSMLVNFRYPENVDPALTMKTIEDASKPFEVSIKSQVPYLLFDPTSSFVQTLLHVYQTETGDYLHQPETIGGGTYAKEAKNSLAFGSAFPGRNDLIHSPDEHIHLVDFLSSMAIYAHAIYALGTTDALKV